MPECPECHEKIDHLDVEVTLERTFSIELDSKGVLFHTDEKSWMPSYVARCPKCSCEIGESEDAAKAFLKGEHDG